MFAVVYRKRGIARFDVLFKKYNVKVVRIRCSGNRIPFIERELIRFSLDALSIFKLLCKQLCGCIFHYPTYNDYSVYIDDADK